MLDEKIPTTLGKIEKEKLQQIYDTYKVMGLIKKQIDIDALVPDIDKQVLIISILKNNK